MATIKSRKLAFIIKFVVLVLLSAILSFYLSISCMQCLCEQEHDVWFMLPYILVLGPFNVLWLIKAMGLISALVLNVILFLAPMLLCVLYALLLRLQKPKLIGLIVSLVHVVSCAITLLCVAYCNTSYTLFRRGELDALDVQWLMFLAPFFPAIFFVLVLIRRASLEERRKRDEGKD